jgi:2-methylcitrate dehydratase PrpD
MTAAERLATFACELRLEQIPEPVREAAKLHLLDTLGCGLAAHALDTAPAAREAIAELGGSGPCTAIGMPAGRSPHDAALVNGTTCHALDFDDTHPGAVAHVSVAVAPAAIAMAEALELGGEELLIALVAGNELTARIGMAAGEDFHAHGFHPTAVCGVFGAAAAAARLRGLDAATSTRALGIAGSLASGLLEFLADGSSTKRLHPGFAAHAGVIAAALAAHGATGPASVLEGRFGVYRAFLGRDDVDIDEQLDDLGTRWETPRIAFKPYPACHYVHAPLDATVAAVTDEGLEVDEIDELVLVSPPAGVPMVLEPAEGKARPRSEYEAKFSLPYSVASYLLRGPVDVMTYTDDAIGDEQVLELAGRVRYEVKNFDTAGKAFPGGVRIRTRDGREVARELRYQRGDVENPMSDADVLEKFAANASLALEDNDRDALAEAATHLEDQVELLVLRLLAGARRRVPA